MLKPLLQAAHVARSSRSNKALRSRCQLKKGKFKRNALNPAPAPQPHSRSILGMSKISGFHISVKFTEADGCELNPHSQRRAFHQSLAPFLVRRSPPGTPICAFREMRPATSARGSFGISGPEGLELSALQRPDRLKPACRSARRTEAPDTVHLGWRPSRKHQPDSVPLREQILPPFADLARAAWFVERHGVAVGRPSILDVQHAKNSAAQK